MSKKISVLIPTYKPGWYFERCLKSIEEQTLDKKYFKVYIALNGPKKDYEDLIIGLLKQYSFEYAYFYIARAGVSNARNLMIESSVEDYITFVDDDDVLSCNYLEQLLLKVTPFEISVSNMCLFSQIPEDSHPNYIGKSFTTLNQRETSLFKTRKFFSSPCAKLVHRGLIADHRFNTKLKIGEDSLFMAEISKRVRAVNKTDLSACYYVYVREGSASRSKVIPRDEFKRLSYLVFLYSMMLLKGYNIPFILSRIVASMKHFKRVFK